MCRKNAALRFVGGDGLHQGHHLALNGLVLDLGVGPQKAEAEAAVEKQEALDLPRLGVAVVEEGDGHVECRSDLLEPGSADPVDPLLVLLDLLKADAQLVAELRLGDPLLDAAQPNLLSEFDVGLAGTALLHSLRGVRLSLTVVGFSAGSFGGRRNHSSNLQCMFAHFISMMWRVEQPAVSNPN